MGSIRLYLPLAIFILSTSIIGFGFVIPHSAIAGFNSLTLGFASTILGAGLTYFTGMQMALRPARQCPLPLRVRINRWINAQRIEVSGGQVI